MNALTKLRTNLNAGLKAVTWNSGNWVDSDKPGNVYSSYSRMQGYSIPGQAWNYESLVGPLHANSAYMACLRWIIDNFVEAPPCIKIKGADGKKVIDPNHSLLPLFEDLGHEDYDDTVLWAGTLIDYIGHGDAYWLPVYNGLGAPVELRWMPSCYIKPVFPRAPKIGDPPIEYYELTFGIERYKVPVEDVIHFQFGAQPDNPYLGLGRGDALLRDIFQDNEATEYSGTILKNMGQMGRVVSPKDIESAKSFDAKVVAENLAAQSTGRNRGKTVALERPLDIWEPQNSPEKMALDKIRQIPESRIAAVIGGGIAQVVGLMVGNTMKTYANYGEARSAAWEEFMLPTMRIFSRQATRQLVRRIREYKQNVWFGFDYREIRALQEDQDKVALRSTELFKVGLWDAARALTEIGDEPKPEDEGRMFAPPIDPNAIVSDPATGPDGKPITPTTAKKMIEEEFRTNSWIARIEGELEAMEGEPVKAGLNGHAHS